MKALHEKARNRNPDEFYFAMVNQKTKVRCTALAPGTVIQLLGAAVWAGLSGRGRGGVVRHNGPRALPRTGVHCSRETRCFALTCVVRVLCSLFFALAGCAGRRSRPHKGRHHVLEGRDQAPQDAGLVIHYHPPNPRTRGLLFLPDLTALCARCPACRAHGSQRVGRAGSEQEAAVQRSVPRLAATGQQRPCCRPVLPATRLTWCPARLAVLRRKSTS